MKTDYIFFDCWDTLITYREKTADHGNELLKFLRNEKGEEATEEEKEFFKETRHKVFRNFFSQNQYEIPFKTLMNLTLNLCGYSLFLPENFWESIFLSYLDPTPIPGIIDFLKYLREKKIGASVLSNTIYSYESTRKKIEDTLKINLNEYFSFLLVSSEVGPKKPNPLFFEAGVAKAGITDKSRVFYVGDSPVADAMGSFNAGLKPAYFNWKKNENPRANVIKNLFTFTDYKEFQQFIESEEDYNPYVEGEIDLGFHKNEW